MYYVHCALSGLSWAVVTRGLAGGCSQIAVWDGVTWRPNCLDTQHGALTGWQLC